MSLEQIDATLKATIQSIFWAEMNWQFILLRG